MLPHHRESGLLVESGRQGHSPVSGGPYGTYRPHEGNRVRSDLVRAENGKKRDEAPHPRGTPRCKGRKEVKPTCETDTLELKGDLLTEGIRATAEALDGVGTTYKEQNHGLFGWDLEDHGEEKLPDDFLLGDGTVVQFRKNSRSPFLVERAEDGKLFLRKGREAVCPISWIPRPSFYGRSASDGTPMVKIGQIGGEDCFFICYNNYCAHFSKRKECLFCNLVDTSRKYRSVITRKQADQIGETAAAAFREGAAKHILMTGGCFGNEKEVDVVETILAAIRKQTGLDRIPGTLLPSPPEDLASLRRYHDAGIEAVAFSLEIWDEPLYRALCPGKAGDTPRS